MPTKNPLSEVPGKIAFIGDWHMNTYWAIKTVQFLARANVKAALHTGDTGYTFDERNFLRPLSRALQEAEIDLFFVDGNHEDFNFLNSIPINRRTGLRTVAPKVYHVPRGKRWEWDGIKFIGVGGAHSVDKEWRVPGYSWWPEETIGMTDIAKAVKGGYVDVLISHDVPRGVPVPGLCPPEHFRTYREVYCPHSHIFEESQIRAAETHRELFADQIVTKIKPRLIVHGHYHRNYEVEGDFFGYGPVRVIGLDKDETYMKDHVKMFYMEDIKKLIK